MVLDLGLVNNWDYLLGLVGKEVMDLDLGLVDNWDYLDLLAEIRCKLHRYRQSCIIENSLTFILD